MKCLIILLIINSLSGITIYVLYRFFNWLLIEEDPILNPVKKDQLPYFFTNKNNKLAKEDQIPYFFTDENCECIEDQNNFALTEISNSAQMFDKTTQNGPINDDILIYNDEKIKP